MELHDLVAALAGVHIWLVGYAPDDLYLQFFQLSSNQQGLMGSEVVHEDGELIEWVPPPKLYKILDKLVLVYRLIKDLAVLYPDLIRDRQNEGEAGLVDGLYRNPAIGIQRTIHQLQQRLRREECLVEVYQAVVLSF